MEQLRSIRIAVEIDTNKATYKEDFGNTEEAEVFVRKTLEDIYGY